MRKGRARASRSSRVFPLADRAALVEALAETGLKAIQVASFVSPKHVPQMADTEALFAKIRRRPGVRYEGLWLNEQGFSRARATPGVDLTGKISLYASDAFAKRNNGCTAAPQSEMHQYGPRVGGFGDLTDLALLRVDARTTLPAVPCRSSSRLRIGE